MHYCNPPEPHPEVCRYPHNIEVRPGIFETDVLGLYSLYTFRAPITKKWAVILAYRRDYDRLFPRSIATEVRA